MMGETQKITVKDKDEQRKRKRRERGRKTAGEEENIKKNKTFLSIDNAVGLNAVVY